MILRNWASKYVALILLIAAVSVFQSTSQADPISTKEADEWVSLVRQIRGMGPEFDVKLDAQERVDKALEGLKKFPNFPKFYRDLGDGLHTLGHMAEHEHRFEKAIDYHRSAFEVYSRTGGLKTRESWNDGRQHAIEHIFLNIYDLGIYHERLGSKDLAHRYFDAAFGFALQYELQNLDTERLTPRYDALVDRFERLRIASGSESLTIGKETTPILMELQCAASFISVN